jgi:hypothetical protein
VKLLTPVQRLTKCVFPLNFELLRVEGDGGGATKNTLITTSHFYSILK